jgi:hypothetical protein
MAVQDLGGKAPGKPIEVVAADHQRRCEARFFSLEGMA